MRLSRYDHWYQIDFHYCDTEWAIVDGNDGLLRGVIGDAFPSIIKAISRYSKVLRIYIKMTSMYLRTKTRYNSAAKKS